MKKFLLISYHFPPDAEIGAVRPAEFAIHLPEYGWIPVVLTIKEKYYEGTDRERYKTLKCEIYRTTKFISISSFYLIMKGFLGKNKGAFPPERRSGESGSSSGHSAEGFRSRILRYYNSLIVYLPDVPGWTLPSVWVGMKNILFKKISAIITTSPTTTTHLIGLILKRATGKPWIADFRDPWEIMLKPKRRRSQLSDYLEEKLERAVIKNCDFAVSVTEPMTVRLKTKYPEWASKFTTIPNGYDSKALGAGLENETKYETFTITYIGSLYFGRNPQTLLRAVSEIIRDGSIGMSEMKMRFIGNGKESDGKSVEEMVREMGLEKVVEFVDRIPQSEALREIARSHVALLMAPAQPLQIPGKVYEYIGMRSTILAICTEGATKDLLRSYPFAKVVSPDRLDEMKEALLALYSERAIHKTDDLNRFPFGKYERRAIAKEIALLLDRTTASKSLNHIL